MTVTAVVDATLKNRPVEAICMEPRVGDAIWPPEPPNLLSPARAGVGQSSAASTESLDGARFGGRRRCAPGDEHLAGGFAP